MVQAVRFSYCSLQGEGGPGGKGAAQTAVAATVADSADGAADTRCLQTKK